jgi:exopolyphosphatase/pppGpp-phosphohydrolase
MGTNSLKLYLVGSARDGTQTIQTFKFPWRVGHDFYEHGSIFGSTMRDMIHQLRVAEKMSFGVPLQEMRAVATGVFREISDFPRVAQELGLATGVKPEVLSARVEAELMVAGIRSYLIPQPAVLFDVGGATSEWAWLAHGREMECGSLALGAIRNSYAHRGLLCDHAEYLAASGDACDAELRQLPFNGPVEVIAAGGTASAACRLLGRQVVGVNEISELAIRVLKQGPPHELKSSRQAVFLPGLVILWRILVRCGASHLRCIQGAVRNESVLRLLMTGAY